MLRRSYVEIKLLEPYIRTDIIEFIRFSPKGLRKMANADQMQNTVPAAAKQLGALGVIPFLGLAIAAVLGSGAWINDALVALLAYGAVILSFLGGIQWGFAVSSPDITPRQTFNRLSLSVAPSLSAWGALLLPLGPGLVVLSVSFILVLMVDLRTVNRSGAPSWYPKLRWPLTICAVSALSTGVYVLFSL